MTFMVTFVALLLERFFDWSHLRRWNWYGNLQQMVMNRLPGKTPNALLAVSIIPVLLVVGLIQAMFHGILYGVLELLFQLFVLIYCLGPKNLWADMFVSLNTLLHGDGVVLKSEPQAAASLHDQLLNHIFIQGNRRVFAVIFWFVLLGPVGAVLYRLVSVSITDSTKLDSPAYAQQANMLLAILDWLPIRVFTLFFALGGNFVKVLTCWRRKATWGLESNEAVLTECGIAALGEDAAAQDGSAEKHALGLLDRSFVITLIVIALTTLWF